MSNSHSPTTTPAHSFQERDALGTKRRYHNKHSFCYIVRSGIAGGVAGCVVCILFSIYVIYVIVRKFSNKPFVKFRLKQ